MEIFPHNRPRNHGVRNTNLPDQISGDFAEFRQIGRDSSESRPFTAEAAGRRVREPPEFLRTPRRHFYKIDHGIIACDIPPFRPK